MKSVNTLQQTRPDHQHRFDKIQSTNLNQNYFIEMLVETGLVLHFCQPGHLLTCGNFSSYVAMVAKKEYKPLDSSHKIRKTRIRCFSTFAPRLVST